MKQGSLDAAPRPGPALPAAPGDDPQVWVSMDAAVARLQVARRRFYQLLHEGQLRGRINPLRVHAGSIETCKTHLDQLRCLSLMHVLEAFQCQDPVPDRLPSAAVLAALHARADGPWRTHSYGQPLTSQDLAELLRPLGLHTVNIEIKECNPTHPNGPPVRWVRKGYYLHQVRKRARVHGLYEGPAAPVAPPGPPQVVVEGPHTWVTVPVAAARLRVTQGRIYQLLSEGRLRRRAAGAVYIREDSLEDYERYRRQIEQLRVTRRALP